MDPQITALSQQIQQRYQKASFSKHRSDEIIKAEATWNFSTLLFKLLSQAEVSGILCMTDLIDFHRQYEAEHAVKIDLEDLLSRQWLRIVCGRVQVAARIVSAIFYLDRNDEREFIVRHRDNLRFIKAILPISSPTLLLLQQKASEIIGQWRQLFPATPEWEEFIRLEIISTYSPKDEWAALNTHGQYWDFASDQNGAKYWQRLLEDDSSGINDVACLHQWSQVMLNENCWPNDTLEYMPPEDKQRFVEACFHLIRDEPDLEWSEGEIAKWWWDVVLPSDRGMTEVPKKFTLRGRSFMELHWQLKELNSTFQWTGFHRARQPLLFFLRIILAYEYSWAGEYPHAYKKTKELVAQSLQKPWILAMFNWELKESFPGVLPHLLTNSATAAWAMLRIGNLQPHENYRSDLSPDKRYLDHSKILSNDWLRGLEIALSDLTYHYRDYQVEHEVLFDIFYPLLSNTSEKLVKDKTETEITREFQSRYFRAVNLLEKWRIEQVHSLTSWVKPRLFPYLLPTLYERAKGHQPGPQRNEFKSFEVVRWGMYLTILRLCGIRLIEGEIDEPQRNGLYNLSRKVMSELVEVYTKELFEEEIEVQNAWDETPIKKPVKWWTEPAVMKIFDWGLFAGKLQEFNLFKMYFNAIVWNLPERKSAETPDSKEDFVSWYSDRNRSFITRYRLHFRMLLLMHESVTRTKVRMDAEGQRPEEILRKLESEILQMATQNREDAANGEADIFGIHYEGYSKSTYGHPLLQHLFTAALQFESSNRHELVKLFLDSSLERLLLLHNLLEDSKERQAVREAIQRGDVEKFKQRQVFVTIIQDALIQAANSEDDTKIAEILLEHLESQKNVKSIFENEALLIFQIKAILAYRHNDPVALQNIPIPTLPIGVRVEPDEFEKIRNLIRGVLYLREGEHEKAVRIFEQLRNAEPQNPEFNARLFYARTRQALQDKSKSLQVLEQAYSEWSGYESSWLNEETPERVQDFRDAIIFGKMVRHHHFGADPDFDFLLSQLSRRARFDEATLELIVDNYRRRAKPEQANALLIEVKQFYQDSTSTECPDWLLRLQNSLDRDGVTTALTNAFKQILDLMPDDLVRVMPPNLRDKSNSAEEYLLNQAIRVGSALLEKITSVSDIHDEDKYNDLFVLVLQARLGAWNWQLSDQSRGGLADSKETTKRKNPGRRDWKVTENGRDLAFFEAMICDDSRWTSYIQTHVAKLIEKYAPTIRIGFVVVYHEKGSSTFEKNWQEYRRIVRSTATSKPFEIQDEVEECLEITPEIGRQNLKVGKSKHGGVTLYHIFLNLNYIKLKP